MNAAPLLQLDQVTMRFGGLAAVNAVDLVVRDGELLGLIGPNGAGKTTIFNVLTGAYRPTTGRIVFDGRDITGLSPHRVARLGIARTFQNIRLFAGLSVVDTVRVACNQRRRTGPVQAWLRTPAYTRDEAAITYAVEALLDRMKLTRWRDAAAVSLPYGEQRRLELARALAMQPRLLLLDEPAAGMNPAEKIALIELIKGLHAETRLAILLVEHSMKVVMGLAGRVAVLDYGIKIAEGTPAGIQSDPKVIAAYLGENYTSSIAHH